MNFVLISGFIVFVLIIWQILSGKGILPSSNMHIKVLGLIILVVAIIHILLALKLFYI